MPFAHPSLSLLIYHAVYAQTLPLERVRYDPMPLPLVALAATAVSPYLLALRLSKVSKDVRRVGRLGQRQICQA